MSKDVKTTPLADKRNGSKSSPYKEDSKLVAFSTQANKIMTTATKDSDESKIFLYTYRKYRPPEVLLDIWTKTASQMIESQDKDLVKYVIRCHFRSKLVSVAAFMNLWMSEFWNQDFKVSEQEIIQKYIPRLPGGNGFKFLLLRLASEKRTPRTPRVYSTEEERDTKLKNLRSLSFSPSKPVDHNRTPSIFSTSSRNLFITKSDTEPITRSRSNTRAEVQPSRLDDVTALANFGRFTTDQLANSITYQFSVKFLQINPCDVCTHVGWSQTKMESTQIQEMIRTFNKTSRWVITEVLSQPALDAQIHVVEKMIEIAKKCEELQNFDGMLAIICGLSHYSIQNLKELWRDLPPEQMARYKEIEEMMSPLKNFRGYNERISAGLEGPAIPYIGIIMRDITFLMENKIYNADGTMNHDLMTQVWKKLSIIRTCQTQLYNLVVPAHLLDFLDSVRVMSDDDRLHEIFLERSVPRRKKAFSLNTLRKKIFS